ncbi:MAG: hypothetical protein NTX45_17735 [Proteobacteria bacterium]|nr:hypothetical protein [Pseudomonadota bacterium]
MRPEIRLKNALLEHKPWEEIVNIISDADPTNSHGLTTTAENPDSELATDIMRIYFWNGTPLSKDIAKALNITKESLVSLYKKVNGIKLYQDVLSKHSVERRQISFTKELLEPSYIPQLKRILHASIIVPSAVEFHPSPTCPLRCKGCSSVQGDDFLKYPNIGNLLDIKKLKMLIDMFTEIGVKNFTFSGGGEPCATPLLTFPAIEYVGSLRHMRNLEGIRLALYTSGVFNHTEGNAILGMLTDHVDKIRFSIDAPTRDKWLQYKGAKEKHYDFMRNNLEMLLKFRNQKRSRTRIGVSYLVSNEILANDPDKTISEMIAFLCELEEMQVNFCDIKELAVSSDNKRHLKPTAEQMKNYIKDLVEQTTERGFGSMDVVFDDALLYPNEATHGDMKLPEFLEHLRPCLLKSLQDRCWVAITGRILTVGPSGELQPCCDSDNPGFQAQCTHPLRLGILTDFDDQYMLESQFQALWDVSLKKRMLISQGNCPYCVPSNFNYNYVVEKLYQDWAYGVLPEEQPIHPGIDKYLIERGRYA